MPGTKETQLRKTDVTPCPPTAYGLVENMEIK